MAQWHNGQSKPGQINSFHSIHNVVDGGVLQTMWEELEGEVLYTVINSLSDNHDYLKTL